MRWWRLMRGITWGAAMGLCGGMVGAATVAAGAAQSAPLVSRSAAADATGPAVRPSPAVATACATSHPASWIGCVIAKDPRFGNTPLSDVAIPGAHDSGTFNLNEHDFDTQSGSDCTSYSPVFASVAALVKQWSEAQNIDYTHQLNDGVRYFDVRVAYTGNAQQGWRIVHTQFSRDPLRADLASIASWAKAHPAEVVIVDVQHLCYDNAPDSAADTSLWSDFAPLAGVSFDPSQGHSVATATLRDITVQHGGGHNVVLMLPNSVLQPATLLDTFHVHATFVSNPAAAPPSGAPSPEVPEAYAWASTVSPASPSDYTSANQALEAFPTTFSPPLGSLRGKGLYQSQLIYSLSSDITADLAAFKTFGGLIPASPGASPGSAAPPALPAWELGLWTGGYSRAQVLAQWGHQLNVVVSDGVQYAGYVPAVVEQNAAS
jgi:hypothetical protein